MDGPVFLYILIAIVSLIINILICTKFADIAEDKGYSHSTYFWCCFFLGITGYIMVAALPDATLRNRIRTQNNAISQPANNGPSQAVAPPSPNYKASAPGSWTCTCGRVNASYVSSCFCGKSKREVMSQKES